MKRILKVLVVLILLIVLAAFILPFVFKDEIIARAKSEINNTLTAEVDFQDIDISLFRSFPDFSLAVENTTVDGTGKFEGVRLAEIETFAVDLNLFSVISGSEYELEAISVENANIHVLLDSTGAANYDIMKESADTSTAVDTTGPSDFKLVLQQYSLNNVNLLYEDVQGEILARLKNLNHTGTGDFTERIVDLSTNTQIEKLTVEYAGIEYLNQVNAQLDADFTFDQEDFRITFEENLLTVNDLDLNFEGWVAMPEETIDMDLKFNSPENQFKHLLSIIPAIYTDDFADVQTSGDFLLKGDLKGTYDGEAETYPQYDFKFSINEASFQYPDLPASVNNIAVDAHIYNRSNQLDNTVIEIPKAYATVAGAPVTARFSLSKPMSNPTFDAYLKTDMDLKNLTKVVPSEDFDYSGQLKADISLAGNMADIEAERYDNFKAEGMLQASDVMIQSDSLPYDVTVSNLDMDFSPQKVDLKAFQSKVGRSDFAMNGSIKNLMGYALQDKDLIGDFSLNSTLIDLNELSPAEEGATEGSTGESDPATTPDSAQSALEALRLPQNLDFSLKSNIKTLVYDNLNIEDVTGTVKLQNGKAILENLSMNVLEGALVLSGTYNSVPPQPVVDMNFKINGFSFKESYQKLVSIQQLAPIMKYSTGTYSTGFSFKSLLKNDMTPDYNTIKANGSLSTSQLTTSPRSLEKLAGLLKNQSLSTLKVGSIDLSFAVDNGRVEVEPFNFNAAGIDAQVSGFMGLDQSLDYTMNLDVPAKGISDSKLLNQIGVVDGGTVELKVLIGGTFGNPTVKTSLGDIAGNVVDNIKDKAKEKLDEVKEDAVEKVNEKTSELISQAEAKGDQLIAEAQNQADKIVSTAKNTAAQIRSEADKNANKLVAEAQGNFLKEKAAETAAKKLRSEADDKALKVVSEAQKRADQIVQKARDKKEQLVQDARDKSQVSN